MISLNILQKNAHAPFSQEYIKDNSSQTLTEIGKRFTKNPSYEKLEHNALSMTLYDEDNNEIGKCKLGGIIFGMGNEDYPNMIVPNFMIDRKYINSVDNDFSAEITFDIYFHRYNCGVYIFFTRPMIYAHIPLKNMDDDFFQKSDKMFHNCSCLSDVLVEFTESNRNKFYYEPNFVKDDEKLVINLDEMMKKSAKFFTFMNKLTHRWCFHDII